MLLAQRRAGRNSKESRFTESFRLLANLYRRPRYLFARQHDFWKSNELASRRAGKQERKRRRTRPGNDVAQYSFPRSKRNVPTSSTRRVSNIVEVPSNEQDSYSPRACPLVCVPKTNRPLPVRYNHAVSSITVALLQLVLQKLDYLDRTCSNIFT